MKEKIAFVDLLVLLVGEAWSRLLFGAFRSAPEASALGLTTEAGEWRA